jgi:hypothetical protein
MAHPITVMINQSTNPTARNGVFTVNMSGLGSPIGVHALVVLVQTRNRQLEPKKSIQRRR